MLKKQELEEIEKAVVFTIDKIRGTKQSKPLIWHSLRVGSKLMDLGESKETVIAGIMHDLLEDTDCSEEEIKKNFGARVLQLVKNCTFPEQMINANQEHEVYLDQLRNEYGKIKNKDRETAVIKIVDSLDNLPYLAFTNISHARILIEKRKILLKACEPFIGKENIFKELEEKIKKLT